MFRILLLSSGVFTVDEQVSDPFFLKENLSTYFFPPIRAQVGVKGEGDRIIYLLRELWLRLGSRSGPTAC